MPPRTRLTLIYTISPNEMGIVVNPTLFPNLSPFLLQNWKWLWTCFINLLTVVFAIKHTASKITLLWSPDNISFTRLFSWGSFGRFSARYLSALRTTGQCFVQSSTYIRTLSLTVVVCGATYNSIVHHRRTAPILPFQVGINTHHFSGAALL